MRDQRLDEDRKDYMLLVAAEVISDINNMLHHTVAYDGTQCDVYCLLEDLVNASDSET